MADLSVQYIQVHMYIYTNIFKLMNVAVLVLNLKLTLLASKYLQARIHELTIFLDIHVFPCGLVVRIQRFHRCGRGSIPRMGDIFFTFIIQ